MVTATSELGNQPFSANLHSIHSPLAFQSGDFGAMRCADDAQNESIDDMAKQHAQQKDAKSASPDGDEAASFPAGKGPDAKILAAIPAPEFLKLRPGQSREIGRNASIPVEFVKWIEATQEALGLGSFADATLYRLCQAAGIPFQSVTSRRGFAAATEKQIRKAIKRRTEVVRQKIEDGTWVGRGPMRRDEDGEGGE